MFEVFVIILVSILSLILILGFGEKKTKNIASVKVIQLIQKKEVEKDKTNSTLSQMIEYHKNNSTIRYKI